MVCSGFKLVNQSNALLFNLLYTKRKENGGDGGEIKQIKTKQSWKTTGLLDIKREKGKDGSISAVPSASNVMTLQSFYHVMIGNFSSKCAWQSILSDEHIPTELI